ncbi:MAG TPA: hypothetical protein VKM55_19100 [Candidatus Lokiarchaeia archaeon]|nr:hypothetical protein [Candidatus Lokiarchaeia archaeon]
MSTRTTTWGFKIVNARATTNAATKDTSARTAKWGLERLGAPSGDASVAIFSNLS